ncbi:MAG: hypothetical protein FWG57_01250 [Endomicrobia bacterium]|nr:hypothetical protein [Endomicrobiia bacterium]
MKKVKLQNIEAEYKSRIKEKYNEKILSADELIDVSIELFDNTKVEEVDSEYVDTDMLLFQYGTYDWGSGENFEFNITRQFIFADADEPFQLSLTLFFDAVEIESYDCWSMNFETIEDFVNDIKSSQGYKLAKELKCKSFEIRFEQV